jgi:hypothetical protein
MEISEVIKNLDTISKRDFVRLYLAIQAKYDMLKSENPQNLRTTMWAVKNPDKARECLNKSREKVRKRLIGE